MPHNQPVPDQSARGLSIGYISDALSARPRRLKAEHGPPFVRHAGYCCGAAKRCSGCPGPDAVARDERQSDA